MSRPRNLSFSSCNIPANDEFFLQRHRRGSGADLARSASPLVQVAWESWYTGGWARLSWRLRSDKRQTASVPRSVIAAFGLHISRLCDTHLWSPLPLGSPSEAGVLSWAKAAENTQNRPHQMSSSARHLLHADHRESHTHNSVVRCCLNTQKTPPFLATSFTIE
jgi:hypothetical protein